MTFMLATYPDTYPGQRHAYTVHFISAFYKFLWITMLSYVHEEGVVVRHYGE